MLPCVWTRGKNIFMDINSSKESLQHQQPVVRWSLIIVLSTFFVSLLMQFTLWKQYSLEATYMQLKNIFLKESIANDLELGAICNSLNDILCAKNYFSKVIDKEPNNKLALANLAIVLAKQERWMEAEPYFKSYFSLGGSSFDVFYWFGITRKALKSLEEGTHWLLHSLKINPDYQKASETLVDYFLKSNDVVLALSLIGHITRGHPEDYHYWNDFLNRKKFIEPSEEESLEVKNWQIVSLDGANYYLGLLLRENTRLKFFSLFNDMEYNLINKDVLNEMLVQVKSDSEKKIIKVNDRTLKVYPVSFSDVSISGQGVGEIEFFTCETCPNVLGKKFLDNYQLQYWSDNHIYYLSLIKK